MKPLPHRFTIAHAFFVAVSRKQKAVRAVYSLLHYSVGLPRLAVSQPAVLWCSDFPPVGAIAPTDDRPINSETDLADYNTDAPIIPGSGPSVTPSADIADPHFLYC